MPLGFSGGSNLVAMGERYGQRLVRGIMQAGEAIEQGLQRITTNRQLQGLGQTLSQLNPQSPDYPQKLIQIAPNFPFAMQDPRGQTMVAIGAKAHAQWQQSQNAMRTMGDRFGNQVALQGLRHRNSMAEIGARNANRANSDVDLLLPEGEQGLGTDETAMPAENEMSGTDAARSVPLFGTSGGMGSLAERAIGPLRDAQRMTGTKFSKTQVASAIAGEQRRIQQEKMQEDRQSEAAKKAAQPKEMTPFQKGSLEMRRRAQFVEGQKAKIVALEKDMASLDRSIKSRQKESEPSDAKARELATWQEQFLNAKALRDAAIKELEVEEQKPAPAEEEGETVIRQDPKTGKRYRVDLTTKEVIEEVP